MTTHARAPLALTLVLALAACDGTRPPDPIDAGGGDGGPTPTDAGSADAGGDSGAPPGQATLVFEPRFGPDTGLQIDPLWRPSVSWDGTSPVVILLCATDDATCERPVLTREVTAAESDGDDIQNSFGPTLTIGALPAGTYRLMVIADDARSRALGLGWDDDFETSETAWGGVASEWDLLLSADGDRPAAGHNPAPVTREITLTNGETTDLGPLVLGHFHERDLSPPLASETGRLAVVVDGGVRILDLATGAPIEVVAGSGFYTFAMTDPTGDAVDGQACGMIRGDAGVIWVLYREAPSGGFAIPFDVAAGAQLAGGRRVTFAGGEQPCRGRFVRRGGRDYLYVVNASASTMDAPREGLWYADVTGLASGDVAATQLTRADDPLLESGVAGLAAIGDRLFLAISPAAGDDHAPVECRGRHCAFEASLDASGRPALGGGATFLVGQALGGSYPRPTGDVACTLEAGAAGIEIASFHDGRQLLFLGGCNEISVFDLADGTALDYNGALPGRVGLDATAFGEGMTAFTASPDGQTLWVMPQSKSAIHFAFDVGGRRTTFSRWMALPIDLSTGAVPAVDMDFARENLDDHEGEAGLGEHPTPAIDPGLDVHYGFYRRYQVGFAGDTAGTTFGPAALPIGPTIAVTGATLFFRGAGVPGVSGLGKGGNLGAVDLATGRNVLRAHDSDEPYAFWQGGPGGEPRFGLDLTPESGAILATYGLAFVSP